MNVKNTVRIAITLILITTGVYLVSNSLTKSGPNQSKVQVPELIDRNEKIQNGKEWDVVQNHFMTNKTRLATDHKDWKAYLNLSEIYMQEARVTGEHGHYYPAALDMTNAVISANPTDKDLAFRALTNKASVLLSLHEFQKAEPVAEQAYDIYPHNAQINGVMTDIYVELGEYAKAVVYADRMVSMRPDLRSYSRISYLREINGDMDGAIDAMTYAVKAGYPGQEESAWAQLTLGNLYAESGDYKRAEAAYRGILIDREDYPFAYGALGELYISQKDYIKAEETLHKAIDIIPEVSFYVSLSKIYKDQNRTKEFQKIEKEILAMLADDVAHGHNMNLEYASFYSHLLEDHNMALTFAMIEYEKRPKNIDVNKSLAEIFMHLEKYDEAKKHLDIASSTNSNKAILIRMHERLAEQEMTSI
jgi:tetratricopeptide (TPR) repeat protein